ncbi:MAG: HlyD family efflux transporter periplasmic adaptor subunit [Candidatus Aminicenantes bacterium]|nr:HlyD family efflux transporter periplasmic adaptor subunit [Candidatus Aminicenantes bacterium]
MRPIKIHIILLLAICALSVSCSNSRDYRVVKAIKGPFHLKVHANGQLKSSASTYIGCPSIRRFWNYTISFMAPEGKEVKPGEPILGFDARQLQERFMVKNSELETAKNELAKIRLVEQEQKDNFILQAEEARGKEENAKLKSQQPEELASLNEVKKMQMEYELAILNRELSQNRVKNQTVGMETRIHAQENIVKRLETEVAELRESIDRMRVKAPKAGIIVYTNNWDGKKKAVGDRCWVGENVMELPDLTRMEVAAVIPEPEAGKVKTGLPVEIRLDSNPDRVFNGKLDSLGRIFRTKSAEQPAMVFDASITIQDPDPEKMRPGMAAGVDITVSSKANVLQIPETAVIYREEGLFVWKKSLTGKQTAPVTLGARSGGMVEVLSGLEENDRVIILNGGNGEER